jgi:predicted regulator of Ras-like GTPase activity (Roadblock/LC7/MglB family)
MRYLAELSTDVRAAVLLAPDGSLAASDPDEPGVVAALAEQATAVLAAAADGAGERDGREPVGEIEVTMPAGSVFVVRRAGWALAVVAGRYALSSLMRYDLRRVLSDLEGDIA